MLRDMLNFLQNVRPEDLLLNGILLLLAIAIAISLISAHRQNGTSRYKTFNLIDLIATRDGHADRPAFLEMGTFALMAWGFIVLVNKAQWGLLVGYAGLMTSVFVLRAAHAAILKSRDPAAPPAQAQAAAEKAP